jgi:hypothetical protein
MARVSIGPLLQPVLHDKASVQRHVDDDDSLNERQAAAEVSQGPRR